MKTVISASRRTDIPAYYLNWFINAISEKKVRVQNPFYKNKYFEVDLSPEKVEWIVFWSRNYLNLIKHIDYFDAYNLFFHFTILPHHALLEKSLMPISKSLNQIEKLASLFGGERIIWRYDPIVFWNNMTKTETNYNSADFKFLCREMKAIGVTKCYFSIVTPYSKFKNRFSKKYPRLNLTENTEIRKSVLTKMTDISTDYHISLFSCCNDNLVNQDIMKGSCISGSMLNNLRGQKTVSEAKSASRKDCGCTKSIDIGNYDQQPCYFGCIYCYANPVWE